MTRSPAVVSSLSKSFPFTDSWPAIRTVKRAGSAPDWLYSQVVPGVVGKNDSARADGYQREEEDERRTPNVERRTSN